MSYTTLYKVSSEGTVEEYRDFKNSFRGAFLVWDNMALAYLGSGAGIRMARMKAGGMQPVWDLRKDEKVPMNDRIVMMTTFDKVMVKRENLPRVIEAIKDYATRFGPGHLLEQAAAMDELFLDDNCQAVCWNQTSVSADAWWVYNADDDEDEGRQYDVSKDSGHWFLFQEMVKQGTSA